MVATDQRISLFGGWFSKNSEIKHQVINKNWLSMFAGDVEETRLMIRSVYEAMRTLKGNEYSKVVECCRKAYAKARKRLIETQILPEYDLMKYSEYATLRSTNEALFMEIRHVIRETEENWNLLFAGFDDRKTPHLFVISGPGKVEYCDSQGVAAIGSGSMAALLWLNFNEYYQHGSSGYGIYQVLAAKFFAERASNVGRETFFEVVDVERNCTFGLNDQEIENIRKEWERLPKIPVGLTEKLTENLQYLQDIFDENSKGGMDAVAKLLSARTLKDQQ